jgi:hypothetical protein
MLIITVSTPCRYSLSALSLNNKHTRRLLEFASEVIFSSEDIPAHSIPVTIASDNTVYAPDQLDILDEPQHQTSPTTFAEYLGQLPEWERDIIKGNRKVISDCQLPPVTQPMPTH